MALAFSCLREAATLSSHPDIERAVDHRIIERMNATAKGAERAKEGRSSELRPPPK